MVLKIVSQLSSSYLEPGECWPLKLLINSAAKERFEASYSRVSVSAPVTSNQPKEILQRILIKMPHPHRFNSIFFFKVFLLGTPHCLQYVTNYTYCRNCDLPVL